MTLFKKKSPTDIAQAIAKAHAFLDKSTPGTDEYTKKLDDLSKLYEMQDKAPAENRVSKDAIVSGCFALGGVLVIVLFESVGNGIITTKSLSLLPKPKNR